MKKLSDKGFTLVEILLVAVLVMGFGFGGYYVYTQNNNDTEVEVQEDATSEESTGEEQVNESADNLFAIPELGLILSEDVIGYDDLAYTVSTLEDIDKGVNLYSEDLKARLDGCNDTVSIYYYDEDDGYFVFAGASELEYEGQYVFVGYDGPCAPEDAELAAEMTTFRDNVLKAVDLAIDNPL